MTVPGAPSGLAGVATPGQIALSWSAGSGTTVSYDVYRGVTSSGESATPIAVGITGTSYNDTTVVHGLTYYYKVAGVNTDGVGTASSESSAVLAVTASQLKLLEKLGPYRIYDDSGHPLQAGTPVTVEQGGSAATIYSDTIGTAITGAIVYTDVQGRVFFYAESGAYQLSAQGGSVTPDTVILGSAKNETFLVVSGAISAANNLLTNGWRVPRPCKLVGFNARVGTQPTGTNGVTVRITKNATTQGTVNVAPSTSSGSVYSAASSGAKDLPISLATGDVINFDVTTVGGTIAGSNLSVDLITVPA